MPDIDTSPAALRALAEAATPGPWQVDITRHPYSMVRLDGSFAEGEHVERWIQTVRIDPQAKAPYPIVVRSAGIAHPGEPPITMVHIRPEDADYLAAVSPEVVLALLDEIGALRARLAAAEQDRDAADASAEAIEAKFATLCRVGRDCGCSYDAKEHVCMYHSPQLVAAVERAEEAERGRDQAISMAEAAAKFAVADDVERAALKARAEKAEAERERPLTARDMADVFGCVWNAAIGAAHREQRGMEFATILAEAFGAMAYRLQEIAAEENFAHVEVTAAPANPEDPAHD